MKTYPYQIQRHNTLFHRSKNQYIIKHYLFILYNLHKRFWISVSFECVWKIILLINFKSKSSFNMTVNYSEKVTWGLPNWIHSVVDDTKRKIMGLIFPNKQPQPQKLPKLSVASTNVVTFLQCRGLITFLLPYTDMMWLKG